MKKLLILCSIVLLASCVPHWRDYQPQLATQPKDAAKYEADRKACLDDANKRSMKADPLFDADGWRNPRQMVDDCMAAKDYDVTKVQHCC